MRRRHILALAVLAATFAAGSTAGPLLRPSPAGARPRIVAAGGIEAFVPDPWKVRMFPASDARIGFHAFRAAAQREATGWPAPVGLEAYWVDATRVGIPSDYYYLAAEGAAAHRVANGSWCRERSRRVVADRPPSLDRLRQSPGHFVATATGICRRGDRLLRWSSFVAAPGFGPVRRLGIPQSGLYRVLVTVPAGPRADRRIERMLSRVSFGGWPVSDLLRAAAQRDAVL